MDNETKAFISEEMEKLARMVHAGFTAVDKRFDTIEQRLDRSEKRYGAYGYRLETLERDMADLKT